MERVDVGEIIRSKFTYKALNTGQVFYDAIESRKNWIQQKSVSFKTSEKCDLLWTKSTKLDKELLEKFNIISCIPRIESYLDSDFICGALMRLTNKVNTSSAKYFDRFYLESYTYPKYLALLVLTLFVSLINAPHIKSLSK